MSKYERACAGVRGGHYCFSCGVVCMSGPIPCQRIILKSLDCVCLARPWYRTHWMTATAPTVPLQTLMLLFPSKRVQWEPCEAASRPPRPPDPHCGMFGNERSERVKGRSLSQIHINKRRDGHWKGDATPLEQNSRVDSLRQCLLALDSVSVHVLVLG